MGGSGLPSALAGPLWVTGRQGVTASWGGPSARPRTRLDGAAVRAPVDTPGITSGLRTRGPAARTYCPAASMHLTQGPFCAEQGCLATQSFSASPLLSPGARGPSPGSQRHRKVCQPASILLPNSPHTCPAPPAGCSQAWHMLSGLHSHGFPVSGSIGLAWWGCLCTEGPCYSQQNPAVGGPGQILV